MCVFSQVDFVLLFQFMPLFADIVKCDFVHNNQPTGEHIIWKLGMQAVKKSWSTKNRRFYTFSLVIFVWEKNFLLQLIVSLGFGLVLFFKSIVEGTIQCESYFLTFFLAHQISVYIVNNHFKLLCQEKLLLPNCLPRLIKHLCVIGNSLLNWYHNSHWYFLALIFYIHWCSLPFIFHIQ